MLVVGLDLTVLNLALPTIATDLHASASDLQWISDAYSLVLAAAMLPAGLLGDRFGRKKVLIAVAVLLPESRSAQRPSVDILGVILSSAGLAGLTYGFIKAGQDGWTDAAALGAIAAGVAVLAVLVAWERWLTRRSGEDGPYRGGRLAKIRPLIELRLFRSAGFTWGTILSTLVSFAMFGIFFAMPQYFQEV
ncbi:MAG: MFS transporter, partial [Streptosporangiaceae bacterium]